MHYSQRSQDIAPFHVMSLLARAQALEQAGHDVIHLEIGEPDFTTAAPIVRAGQAALAAGHTRYTAARGLPALRAAIAGFYGQRYNVDLDPERVLVTPGGSGALLLASSLLVDPDQHWLLADPGYPCNRHFLRLVEGAAELVPVGPETAYQLTPGLVEDYWVAGGTEGRPTLCPPSWRAPSGPSLRDVGNGNPAVALGATGEAARGRRTSRTSCSVGALVASPANPTGTVLSALQLSELSQALKQRGGHLVVDEIYHGLTYGMDAASVLEVDDAAFVLNSFSKYFGMTGWRLGWLVAPPRAVPELEKLAQNLYISASSIAQHAALACFEADTMAIFEQRRHAFQERRDYLLPALRALGFRIEVEPEGAFYLYCDVSAFTDDAQAFCAHFLETQHVAFTPGLDFGFHRANQHVRLAYTQEVPRLQEAVERIRRGLETWGA